MLIEGNYNNSFFGAISNPFKTEGVNSVSKPMDSKFAKAMSNEGSIFSLAKDMNQYKTALNTDFSLKGFGNFQGDTNSPVSAFLG